MAVSMDVDCRGQGPEPQATLNVFSMPGICTQGVLLASSPCPLEAKCHLIYVQLLVSPEPFVRGEAPESSLRGLGVPCSTRSGTANYHRKKVLVTPANCCGLSRS